jgi:hypothetical protein
MKGFIEISLQNVDRLIAINSIVAVSAFGNRCKISLNASIADYSSRQAGYVTNTGASNQFETDEEVTLAVVKKLIEAAQ